MKEMKLIISNPKQMIALGTVIGQALEKNSVLALRGDLGAGKTTLTKGIGIALGVEDTINSPTFTIMKVYQTKRSDITNLYHLDVYRTSGSSSDFELEEYFYLNGVTVIEWADIIEDLIPQDAIYITISIIALDTREVLILSNNEKIIEALNSFKEANNV